MEKETIQLPHHYNHHILAAWICPGCPHGLLLRSLSIFLPLTDTPLSHLNVSKTAGSEVCMMDESEVCAIGRAHIQTLCTLARSPWQPSWDKDGPSCKDSLDKTEGQAWTSALGQGGSILQP